MSSDPCLVLFHELILFQPDIQQTRNFISQISNIEEKPYEEFMAFIYLRMLRIVIRRSYTGLVSVLFI